MPPPIFSCLKFTIMLHYMEPTTPYLRQSCRNNEAKHPLLPELRTPSSCQRVHSKISTNNGPVNSSQFSTVTHTHTHAHTHAHTHTHTHKNTHTRTYQSTHVSNPLSITNTSQMHAHTSMHVGLTKNCTCMVYIWYVLRGSHQISSRNGS